MGIELACRVSGLGWRRAFGAVACVLAVVGAACGARADQSIAKDAPELTLGEGLTIADVSSWGRRAVNLDAVADAMVRGTLGTPKDGDALKRPAGLGDGERTWKVVKAGEKGEFSHLGRGAYVLCTVLSDADRVMMLDASGDTMVYVNGEPHAGDPYSNGKLHLPVALKQGTNQFLFAYAGRGGLKAKLVTPGADAVVCTDDLTLPDVLSEKPEEYWIGVPIVNASEKARTFVVSVQAEGAGAAAREERIEMPALTAQKAALRVVAAQTKDKPDVGVTITIRDASDEKGTNGKSTRITLRARTPEQVHLRTYVSAIDGSVQYAAITPQAAEGKIEHPALVLSLHGASVEASGQAPCYAMKPDMVVVCPTNRRPYGFDWEDWGRVDAIEAMDNAKVWFNTDPRRQYLTGHSMGGHGTWQLGVLLSDRFAAIGPSAGWLSFDTYANQRGEPTETTETQLRAMFRRAGSASDTIALMPNLKGTGIYILHGDADDNVPVAEARRASEELTKLDIPFEYHEEPGVGHWWDKEGPGTACVDWAPMFELFRSRTLPRAGERTEWHARALMAGVALPPSDGVRIDRAEHAGKMATADVSVDAASGKITITTSNAAAITLGSQVCGDVASCAFEIDGKATKAAKHGTRVSVVKLADGRWVDASEGPGSSAANRGFEGVPVGPFKNAFTSRFVQVYGTRGTAEENAWSLARARYDAEQWWYRGNGRAVMMSDEQFLKGLDAGEMAGNAILYGNTTSNGAAARLAKGNAAGVSRGAAELGGHTLQGDDLGVLSVGSFFTTDKGGDKTTRMYAIVGGTGLTGMRATDRMLYLQSGVGIPDVCVIRADLWTKGTQGIECAGFLGPNLGIQQSEIVWRDAGAAKDAKK
jgi:poly(3-hydroxybutyrate) depolymerase